jgi:PAS domain S-box-containing protein
MRLSTRLAAAMVALVLLTATVVGYLAHHGASPFAGLAAVLAALALAVVLARSLASPLAQMTRIVEGSAHGEPTAMPTGAGGEIGRLAQAFARLAGELRDKTTALEREIEQRRQQERERLFCENNLGREALLDSERMSRGIIDTALDAFVQMDEGGVIIDWNPQARAVFGWSRDEAIGKVLHDLIVPERHRPHCQDGLARFLRSREDAVFGKRFEIEALRRDGNEIKVELSVTALSRRGGTVFNGFIRDMTEAVTAAERDRQSQTMAAVEQLIGGIVHDFNNTLTVITGTIDILADGVADKPRLASVAKLISQAADRGAELTGHLLALARKQSLQPRETDINDLLAAAQGLLRPALGDLIEIETVLEEDVWRTLVDPAQLTTALINLADNARDAMPEGGKFTLATKNVVLDESDAGASREVQPGNYVMIAVSDTGAGIAAGSATGFSSRSSQPRRSARPPDQA